MAYSKHSSKGSSLPGPSIKGAGALPPGTYRGYFEKNRLPGTHPTYQYAFASMPHGIHILEAEAAEALTDSGLEWGREYILRVALSEGGIVARTDGGRFYMADAQSRAPLTAQHGEIHACLVEAAEKKLKLATPVVVEISQNGTIIFQR